MRRDSIFYQLFQQYPALLFELIGEPPDNAAGYTFDSVVVKEPRFEIDGVFLPPEDLLPGIIFFCEVQFQKDKCLYERIFAECFLYFYRNRERFHNWRVVVIYPSRQVEQSDVDPYLSLLESEQVHRIYLDELGDIRRLPVPLALLVLTTVDSAQADEEARYLLSREAVVPEFTSLTLTDIVTTIMMYRYEGSSRREIEQMLGISLQETRAYQEIKEEGREEATRSLILRQLRRRFDEVPKIMSDRINSLSLDILESLSEALLDFEKISDLQAWLELTK